MRPAPGRHVTTRDLDWCEPGVALAALTPELDGGYKYVTVRLGAIRARAAGGG